MCGRHIGDHKRKGITGKSDGRKIKKEKTSVGISIYSGKYFLGITETNKGSGWC